MKAVLSVCALCCLVCLPAAAQRGGGGVGGGFGHGGPGASFRGFVPPSVPVQPFPTVGIPPLGALPAMAPLGPSRSRGFGRGTGGGLGWWPAFYGDDGSAYQPYQAIPTMVVVMPEQQPAPPPRVVQGEVRDYTKTNPPETAQQQGPPPEFSVVGKDRVARSAIAVWSQNGTLHYISPDGSAAQMPLASVDREATEQANAAKGLHFQVWSD